MKTTKIFVILFLLIVFVIGLFATMYFNPEKQNKKTDIENMEAQSNSSCPDMLVKKGQSLALYNTKTPVIEGKNPILFQSLDDYIGFVREQKKRGIECPVLYLQEEVNTQGEDVYRMRPSPFDLQGGLSSINEHQQQVQISDANRMNYPYNENNYPGFDPEGQYVGVYTNLDAIHDSTKQNINSDNPMDPNWGGIEFTRNAVKSGKYEDREITKPVFNKTVNTAFYVNLPSDVDPPVDIL
jgi:hypothetical protein|tara:strand:+ start:5537 stop:6256 length:720 start_codon:yes stop_codon:yes gene_type:complete